MKNLTVETIVKICGGTLYGEELIKERQKEAEGVVLDSRLLQKDYIFIATKGEKVDGHKFIPSVFEKGALAVICETVPEEIIGPCTSLLISVERQPQKWPLRCRFISGITINLSHF